MAWAQKGMAYSRNCTLGEETTKKWTFKVMEGTLARLKHTGNYKAVFVAKVYIQS